MGLLRVVPLVLACYGFLGGVSSAAEVASGSHRLATFKTEQGETFFALAVQPSATDALVERAQRSDAQVVLLVDTSASQSGAYRGAALAAMQAVLGQLRDQDRVKLYAVDVKATPMGDSFAGASDSATVSAVEKLRGRLPLGNTNLAEALHQVRGELVNSSGTRSIVYIGDGASLGEIRSEERFGVLVDALRADRISLHSLAVGPTPNVEFLAALANHTGGVTLVSGEDGLGQAEHFGKQLAAAATISPIWLQQVQAPNSMQMVQAKRLPPLRFDRDSIYIGRLDDESTLAKVVFDGKLNNFPVSLGLQATPEASSPDMSFLPGMVGSTAYNHGLLLPIPGSEALREVARVMNFRVERMVEQGSFALTQGNARGAASIAEMALQIDPNNPQARSIAKLAGDDRRLTALLQQQGIREMAPMDEPDALDALGLEPGDQLEQSSGLLDQVDAERRQNTGRLRAEVRAGLTSAQRLMARSPQQATENLKILRAIVDSEPDVDPAAREELLGQLNSALQVASARTEAFMVDQQSVQQRVAAGEAVERLLADTFRTQARIAQLSAQLNAVMREGRYDEAANEIAPDLAELAGTERLISQHALEHSHMAATARRQLRYQNLRERAFVDAFSLVEKAFIPFVDEPPIVYPDAEVWQRLSRRRLERYNSYDLAGDDPTERRIYMALDEETNEGPFIEESLEQVMRTLSAAHDIPIFLDVRSLEEEGITPDTPVSIELKGIKLRSFIRLLLEDVGLTYMIKDQVLRITTQTTAEENLVTKVYPVGDLVVPIMPPMMGGGMMGGMMGGMGGDMMGGMGGGMMGGMGGGMGGMGGMGMGGMMMVPDDLTLSSKSSVTAAVKPTAENEKKQVSRGPLQLPASAAPSAAEYWHKYFAGLQLDDQQELEIHQQRVHRTISALNAKAMKASKENELDAAKAEFKQMRALIEAAMLHDHTQPWMYEAYAIALLGSGGDNEEIERALLSAVDFADSPEDILNVARHLDGIGSKEAALRLCMDVSRVRPYDKAAYVFGLQLAKELDDLAGLTWACVGVLSQAWSGTEASIEEEARLLARATHLRLKEAENSAAAEQFAGEIENATAHDVIVRVTWTGQADIDLIVEEPSGTICNWQNRRTAGGGVLLEDTLPSGSGDGTFTETYVCPQGFSGVYRLAIHRVWGNVATGNVSVSILTDVGRPTQRLIQKQVPLREQNALIAFDVRQGRRVQRLADAQLEDIAAAKQNMGNVMLAQLAGGSDLGSTAAFFRDVRRFGGNRFGGPGLFGMQPAIGYEPVIQVLPEGATMMPSAILSADRRYVRVTPNPMFSQIGDVQTFNFVSGETNQQGGGGAGGFGGAGIGGGGIGGGMGGMGGMM